MASTAINFSPGKIHHKNGPTLHRWFNFTANKKKWLNQNPNNCGSLELACLTYVGRKLFWGYDKMGMCGGAACRLVLCLKGESTFSSRAPSEKAEAEHTQSFTMISTQNLSILLTNVWYLQMVFCSYRFDPALVFYVDGMSTSVLMTCCCWQTNITEDKID